jgi:molybdopterin biosynthesis enzyme MoaB
LTLKPTIPDTQAGFHQGVTWTAIVLLLVTAGTFALRPNVSADALAPLVTTMLFGLAAAMACIGLLFRQTTRRIGARQVAGLLTMVGIVVSVTIEAEQIARLLASSDQTD